MNLRPYQEKAINSIFSFFQEQHGAPVLALPTGTGKSVIIAEYIKREFLLNGKKNILMLTHVKELVEQNYNKLIHIWPAAPVGIYSAGLNRKDILSPIIFGTIQSIVNKKELFNNIDIIIIDECHLVPVNAETRYLKLINYIKSYNSNVKIIGLTATPYRLDSGSLIDNGIFTNLIFDLTTADSFIDLIKNNYLTNLVTKNMINKFNVAGVKKTAGEYNLKDLSNKFNNNDKNIKIIQEILKNVENRKHILIFAINIEHVEKLNELLKLNNQTSTYIHSKINADDRKKRLESFEKGIFKFLINCDVLTTGYDYPAIDCIVVLRATTSTSLWVQMVGRGMRVAENKENCLILDFATNIERLGPVNNPLINEKVKGDGNGMAPLRICPACNVYHMAAYRTCPECGYIYENESEGKLQLKASNKNILEDRKKDLIEIAKILKVNNSLFVDKFDNKLYIRFTFNLIIDGAYHRKINSYLSWEVASTETKNKYLNLLFYNTDYENIIIDSTKELYSYKNSYNWKDIEIKIKNNKIIDMYRVN